MDSPVDTEEDRTTDSGALLGGSETILLAEDDADIRRITKELLEQHGYKVIEAVDGQDAVDRFRERNDGIELLLTDVVMPRKSGRQVYEEIHQAGYDRKVLFMSGYPADMIGRRGVLEAGLNFIRKPSKPAELLKKVRTVLDSG